MSEHPKTRSLRKRITALNLKLKAWHPVQVVTTKGNKATTTARVAC
jgi:hypothetical protein